MLFRDNLFKNSWIQNHSLDTEIEVCVCVCVSTYIHTHIYIYRASLVAQMVKYLPVVQEIQVWSLGWEDPQEKGMATHPVFFPG